jgi:hypothetical protein
MTERSERDKWLKWIREMQFQRWGFSSLSDWLKCFSIETWLRLGFGNKNWTAKTLETTITQNFVFEFYTYAQQRVMPIKLFESRDERSNGNDLEIVVETANGYLILPIQAKVIDKNYRYPSIKYKSSKGYQIEMLLQYARNRKGIAFYLFYNYCDDARTIAKVTKPDELSITLFGCSIASAYRIKEKYLQVGRTESHPRWLVPDFEGIHSIFGFPLHRLAEPNLSSWAAEHEAASGDHVAFYTVHEIMKDPNWQDLLPEGIGFVPKHRISASDASTHPTNTESVFNPRFRLVIANIKTPGR